MTKRNGYELVPGARWLFVGSRRDFPEGPVDVEIRDLRRGEVRVKFLEGALEGKLEWHKPGKLFAPLGEVDKVRQRLEREQLIADAALSEAEAWAVLTVGSAFGAEILSGNWRYGSDADRIAELLEVPLEDVVSVPLAERAEDGQWHLPGRHALYLARRLCERYPTLVHDYAAVDLDSRLVRTDTEGSETPAFHRGGYLLICSWCHVAPDCSYLENLQRQRKEIEWLYATLREAVGRLGRSSPQAKYAVLQNIRQHYQLDRDQEMESSWPGVP